MSSRPKLSRVGMRRPTDVSAPLASSDEPTQPAESATTEEERPAVVALAEPVPEPSEPAAQEPVAAATPQPRRTRATRAERREPGSGPASRAKADVGERPFLGTGRPVQTAVLLPNETADRLSELARAAGVSMTALAVAVLERHVPLETGKVRELVLATARPRRGSAAIQTTEMNLRLPSQLRVRMDELISALPSGARIKRAHLISGVLDAHLAADADGAYRQVTEYEGRSMRHELAA